MIPSHRPLTLLGGLTPAQFMRRYWQRKPLLVRAAVPGMKALLDRRELFALACQADVESRLILGARPGHHDWQLLRSPLRRKDFPPVRSPAWTLLVQGVDLHHDAAHALLNRFRFVPDARLDDLMISWASDGGGVGPHTDSYDVFLLQAQGRRRWRIAPPRPRVRLRPGLPVKILQDFEPQTEWILEPGDMLYLPPNWAHEGVALGECMTYSVGFRVPDRDSLAQDLLQRMAETEEAPGASPLYRDAGAAATPQPGRIPAALAAFAEQAIDRLRQQPLRLARALGESLTEPKPHVWFAPGVRPQRLTQVRLDRRSRMMYDAHHIFLNGESWRASGADARLMRRLADTRALGPEDLKTASPAARDLLRQWCEDGWLQG
jgi:50S ribosomal protein L16 3-hydroxylase